MAPSPVALQPSTSPIKSVCTAAHVVYGAVRRANQLAMDGNEADALTALGLIAEVVEAAMPGLDHFIATELQPADARHRTEGLIARVIRRQSVEHLHAANDQVASPQQPGPSVA